VKRKKSNFIILGACAALLAALSPAEAVFQNWQSRAFEPGEEQKEATEQRQGEHKEEVKEGKMLDWEESEAHYYQEVAPKDMEEEHNYLQKEHPLQEKPLTEKRVE
jgi:hypothetical protein